MALNEVSLSALSDCSAWNPAGLSLLLGDPYGRPRCNTPSLGVLGDAATGKGLHSSLSRDPAKSRSDIPFWGLCFLLLLCIDSEIQVH